MAPVHSVSKMAVALQSSFAAALDAAQQRNRKALAER
jgi:hypothetical protein